jgi:6-phosphofructokinase
MTAQKGIVTGGGDCPGLDTVIGATVRVEEIQ